MNVDWILYRCAVFGRAVGEDINLEPKGSKAWSEPTSSESSPQEVEQARERVITAAELAKHSTSTDCWVALYGMVYDFTDFLEEHPSGAQVRMIDSLCWSVG